MCKAGLVGALVTTAMPVAAQRGSTAAATSAAADPKAVEAKAQDLDGRQMELRGMQDTLDASEAQRRKIGAEIEILRGDRARFMAALLSTTERVSAAERKISEAEARLDTLSGSEQAIRRSLEGRRAIIAEVLASLQRIGRKPPPALLVEPEDMLQAIRTSMLLGSVLPEMRAETEALASDLSDLQGLRRSITSERETLAREAAKLTGERQHLTVLLEARQNALGQAEKALVAEQDKAQELAKQAASLKDLIARMEVEIGAAGRGAEAARRAEEARRSAEAETTDLKPKVNFAPFRDSGRLAPAIAFGDAKGLLPLPVSGTLLKNYGAPDGYGSTEKGLFIGARRSAVVAAPCDGWVAYSGPYRTYGQLLIINAGGGYYVVLAGMERIDVELGQFVLTGEPVAVMGDGSTKTAATLAVGAAQPILYVEFRKDGAAIDPGPWWAKPELQKVRG
jgi:septal ring factor EnvC (AmiA/AmiB activator)